jgi:hypothetical protein
MQSRNCRRQRRAGFGEGNEGTTLPRRMGPWDALASRAWRAASSPHLPLLHQFSSANHSHSASPRPFFMGAADAMRVPPLAQPYPARPLPAAARSAARSTARSASELCFTEFSSIDSAPKAHGKEKTARRLLQARHLPRYPSRIVATAGRNLHFVLTLYTSRATPRHFGLRWTAPCW